MTNWCSIEAIDFDECEPAEDSTSQALSDEEPYAIARALQEAAVELLGLDCHKDGDVTWGPPNVDNDCCCGQIMTGIVTPENFGESACFTLRAYRWHVLITWDESKVSVAHVSRDSSRVVRHLLETACCKLKSAGYKRIQLSFETSTNGYTETTECKHLHLTVAA